MFGNGGGGGGDIFHDGFVLYANRKMKTDKNIVVEYLPFKDACIFILFQL